MGLSSHHWFDNAGAPRQGMRAALRKAPTDTKEVGEPQPHSHKDLIPANNLNEPLERNAALLTP